MSTLTLLPTKLDLTIYAGDGFAMQINFRNQDDTPAAMTGTWLAQIRHKTDDTVLTAFSVDITSQATGLIILRLTGEQTRTLPDECVWDVQNIPTDGQPRTWYRGIIKPSHDVSR
jgi:hypothetical protein